ncbi:MAG TPA: hypothetical protein PK348_07545, partial [Spirochaetota bacterium]|nr:hypothetical protein [Spirochaetota bacterium]
LIVYIFSYVIRVKIFFLIKKIISLCSQRTLCEIKEKHHAKIAGVDGKSGKHLWLIDNNDTLIKQ